jgi:ABC-2 type transport system permease protein
MDPERPGTAAAAARQSRPRAVARALLAQLRVAWMVAMQYRASFFGEALMALLATAWVVAPLFFVFHYREGVAGWTWEQSLLVGGSFVALSGILEGFIDPNLRAVVEHVRTGTLDFVLLKPVDAQWQVSFQRSAPTKLPHVAVGFGIVAWAAARLPEPPGVAEIAVALLLLACAVAILYGLWTLVVSTAFWFVRVDNLSYLLMTLLDTGRWPIQFYQGAVRIFLTFLLPVGLMTSWPAMALRGMLEPSGIAQGVAVAVAFLLASRLMWVTALRRYASASS